jgi:hypothetical protein
MVIPQAVRRTLASYLGGSTVAGSESGTSIDRWTWLAPLAAMVLVCVLAAWANRSRHQADDDVRGVAGLPVAGTAGNTLQPAEFAADVHARHLWVLAEMAVLLAEALIGAYLVASIWDYFGRSLWAVRIWIEENGWEYFAIVVLSTIALVAVRLAAKQQPITHAIRHSLPPRDLNWSQRITDWSDGATPIVVLLIALRLSLLSRNEHSVDHEDTHSISSRVRLLGSVLYMSSALLVLGTLEIAALQHWSEAQFPAWASEHVVLHQLANTAALSAGGFFSLLLAAGYLPALAVLRARGWAKEQLCNRGDTAIPSSQWLKDRELVDGGSLLALQRVAMILAPVIAGGTATELIAKITSVGK